MSEAPTLAIFTSETVTVSEVLVVELIILRLTSRPPRQSGDIPTVSVQEYRDILGDSKSTDDQIRLRLEYLEMLCRHIIRSEVKSYGKGYIYGKR